jgi:hypothetical protein
MIVETNNNLKIHIKAVNDNQNHIHDVVVDETNETSETSIGIIVVRGHELNTLHEQEHKKKMV